jgi:hypothetical protein
MFVNALLLIQIKIIFQAKLLLPTKKQIFLSMKVNILIVKKMGMEYNMIIKVKFYMKVNFVMEREMGGEGLNNIKVNLEIMSMMDGVDILLLKFFMKDILIKVCTMGPECKFKPNSNLRILMNLKIKSQNLINFLYLNLEKKTLIFLIDLEFRNYI